MGRCPASSTSGGQEQAIMANRARRRGGCRTESEAILMFGIGGKGDVHRRSENVRLWSKADLTTNLFDWSNSERLRRFTSLIPFPHRHISSFNVPGETRRIEYRIGVAIARKLCFDRLQK